MSLPANHNNPVVHLTEDRATAPQQDFRTKPRIAASPVLRYRGEVVLPSFSIENTWLGASEIIRQFNYYFVGAPNGFSFPALPPKPANVNYCLCVRYRVGDTVTRYKLWEDVTELLYVDLYAGQPIRPYFSLEVWNVETDGSPAVNAADLSIYLSKLYKPSPLCSSNPRKIESEATTCASLEASPFPLNLAGGDTFDFGLCSAHTTN